MTRRELPDSERCIETRVDGKRCTLPRAPHGDQKRCGLHFHARRRKSIAAAQR